MLSRLRKCETSHRHCKKRRHTNYHKKEVQTL